MRIALAVTVRAQRAQPVVAALPAETSSERMREGSGREVGGRKA